MTRWLGGVALVCALLVPATPIGAAEGDAVPDPCKFSKRNVSNMVGHRIKLKWREMNSRTQKACIHSDTRRFNGPKVFLRAQNNDRADTVGYLWAKRKGWSRDASAGQNGYWHTDINLKSPDPGLRWKHFEGRCIPRSGDQDQRTYVAVNVSTLYNGREWRDVTLPRMRKLFRYVCDHL